MKIAVVGGGGFRAPIVWESIARIADETVVDDVALYDVSGERLAAVALVIEGLRRENGGGPDTRTTTDIARALDGADVIFCAIRVGGLDGRIVDEKIPLKEGVLGQETVGPGGICFALRTLPVMLEIAGAAERHAPQAWFLNFTNPAGLVTEGLRSILGDRVVGICDSPQALFHRVAAVLGRPSDDLSFDYAGLNHLGWLLGIDALGRDLLPGLLADDDALARIEEANLFGREELRQSQTIPNEYLIYLRAPEAIARAFTDAGETRAEVLVRAEESFYGASPTTPEEGLAAWRRARDMRFGTYMAEVREARPASESPGPIAEDNSSDWDYLGYAGIAASFVRAVSRDTKEFLALNVANGGRLSFLDDDAVVEVTCGVDRSGARPAGGRQLRDGQADLVAHMKGIERLVIEAATSGRRAPALEAMVAHPVVPSRAVAERILERYLAAFPDLAARLR